MRIYGWAGLLLLLVSEYCLIRRIEPFYSSFYSFAWWSYVLLADNLLLRLRGRSLLCGRREELRRMLPLSVFSWLLFECYNLRLQNWAYNGVPAEIWLRWPGYAVAFATVFPGIFITADLIEALCFGRHGRISASECEPLAESPRTRPGPAFLALGLALSAVPVIWPRYFFAAVWIGPIFLLDPLLERFGVKSFSLQIEAGQRRRIFSLLAGGLVCGILWEFWNFWAGSHWVYSVPYFGSWKMFQMPLLGFLGFPPFVLECWLLYHLFEPRHLPRYISITVWIFILVFCLWMFHEIDHHTVLRFA